MFKPSPKLTPVEASDRRTQQRSKIIRVGVLEHEEKTFFCVLTNMSATGVQVKLYSPIIPGSRVRLRVADEEPLNGQMEWVKGNRAGIRFLHELDPAVVLPWSQKKSPGRRRAMPRIKAAAYAILRVNGRTFPARLCDISSKGARVSTRETFLAGDVAVMILPDLPPTKAFVRWSEDRQSGLVFETPIPMQVIADWISGRLRVIT